MDLEIYTDGTEYYVRSSALPAVLRWHREEGRWACRKEEVTVAVQKTDFGELPGDLQEEILAFMTRSEAMGNQIWGADR